MLARHVQAIAAPHVAHRARGGTGNLAALATPGLPPPAVVIGGLVMDIQVLMDALCIPSNIDQSACLMHAVLFTAVCIAVAEDHGTCCAAATM